MPAHPRSRGENRCPVKGVRSGVGSSPLTRGKRLRVLGGGGLGGLIPAHAGKTRRLLSSTRGYLAHPRSRGENTTWDRRRAALSGSSPLTRGKHVGRRYMVVSYWLIPAHAGKTSPLREPSNATRAHPRSRGENYFSGLDLVDDPGSSPLTRGKRGGVVGWWVSSGLIPAHAGKTWRRGSADAPLRAHPRSRGENPDQCLPRDTRTGSSPLTRGKLLHARDGLGLGRLIPAHAGKTRC